MIDSHAATLVADAVVCSSNISISDNLLAAETDFNTWLIAVIEWPGRLDSHLIASAFLRLSIISIALYLLHILMLTSINYLNRKNPKEIVISINDRIPSMDSLWNTCFCRLIAAFFTNDESNKTMTLKINRLAERYKSRSSKCANVL